MSTATTDDNAMLDARYGRTPQRRLRERIVFIVAGAMFVVVFAAWVVWAAFDNGQGNIEAQDLAHSIIDDASVSITWQVSVKEGTAVSCALQAQNEAHAIVGWKIVDLAASTTFHHRYQEVVRTSQRAVTGLIYRCWLT